MLGSTVKAKRDRDCSQDLHDEDVKTVGSVLQVDMAVQLCEIIYYKTMVYDSSRVMHLHIENTTNQRLHASFIMVTIAA